MRQLLYTILLLFISVGSFAQSEVTQEDSLINLIQPAEGVYVPNVFTPNGDGVNDQFRVVANNITEYNLTIYNRWGDLVFEGITPEIIFDGRTFSGEKLLQGNYYYVLIAKSDGADYSTTGTLTLLR